MADDKEYDGWTAAIEVGMELAPCSGFLFKKKGRHHPSGLTAMMGGWDKRYFEVLQVRVTAARTPSHHYPIVRC